jgi:hypothetical protein
MSLMLIFRSMAVRTVGPLKYFRVDGAALRNADGELIAKHERNVWDIDGERYPRVECEGSVSIWFERASKPEVSRKFGPHHDLAMFDGVAYIGKHVFASFRQETRTWYSHEIGHHWRTMVVESVPREL